MKRIRPETEYRDDGAYPSLHELDRRSFFRRAAGAAAATVGALTAGSADARGRSRGAKEPEKITLSLPSWTPIGKSGYRAQKLDVWTRDQKLAKFLRDSRERAGIGLALGIPLRSANKTVVQDGRALYRLERRLARAVAKRYRQRTHRRATPPDVMLYLTKRGRYIRTGGVMVRPVRPVPRPHVRHP